MPKSTYHITSTNSVIGAIAIGSGARAEATVSTGPAAVKPTRTFKFTFEAKGATREQIAKWLRTAADAVEGDYAPVFAKTVDGAARAWSLEPDESSGVTDAGCAGR